MRVAFFMSRFFDIEGGAGAIDTVPQAGGLQVLTGWNQVCWLSGHHCSHWNDLHTCTYGKSSLRQCFHCNLRCFCHGVILLLV